MMYQPIVFHEQNKKVRSEKKMYHFISQTKHTLRVVDYENAESLGVFRRFEKPIPRKPLALGRQAQPAMLPCPEC